MKKVVLAAFLWLVGGALFLLLPDMESGGVLNFIMGGCLLSGVCLVSFSLGELSEE